MSTQTDWVGGGASADPKPCKDIRNTRPTVAEEKAQLALELGRIISKCPVRVQNGSVNLVREWRATKDAAAKVCANSRSSAQQLRTAINSMSRFA